MLRRIINVSVVVSRAFVNARSAFSKSLLGTKSCCGDANGAGHLATGERCNDRPSGDGRRISTSSNVVICAMWGLPCQRSASSPAIPWRTHRLRSSQEQRCSCRWMVEVMAGRAASSARTRHSPLNWLPFDHRFGTMIMPREDFTRCRCRSRGFGGTRDREESLRIAVSSRASC